MLELQVVFLDAARGLGGVRLLRTFNVGTTGCKELFSAARLFAQLHLRREDGWAGQGNLSLNMETRPDVRPGMRRLAGAGYLYS